MPTKNKIMPIIQEKNCLRASVGACEKTISIFNEKSTKRLMISGSRKFLFILFYF